MAKDRILIIEDEHLIGWSLQQNFQKEGYEAEVIETGKDAVRRIKEEVPDLVLLDNRLPGCSGMEILEEIRREHEGILVILMTAYGDEELAVQAIKAGAYDYVKKPFKMDEITLTVEKALETVRLRKEVSELKEERRQEAGLDHIMGASAVMLEIFELIRKIARSDATTVLILGESGTGKDLVAKAIHYESSRWDAPFVPVNCSALPESLLESELLGYERGAFTDAKRAKKGLIELADRGTLFLDEIGELHPMTQVKLLRIIEERKFKRIGGTQDIEANIRIIAATNRDLESAVREGAIRQDFYHRLKVIPLHLPPLRERGRDVILIAKYFIDRFNRELRKNVLGMSKETENLLLAYLWPGNVRELRNVIERIMILEHTDYILPEHLPREMTSGESPKDTLDAGFRLPPSGTSLEKVERDLVLQAIQTTDGNQTQAAKLLNISRDVLRYKMKKYGFL